jgi:hypothetical protein
MNELRYVSYGAMILGVLLSLVGLLFKFFHWPDMFKGIMTGPMILLLGVVLFILSLSSRRHNKK